MQRQPAHKKTQHTNKIDRPRMTRMRLTERVSLRGALDRHILRPGHTADLRGRCMKSRFIDGNSGTG